MGMIDTITIASNAYNSWISFMYIPANTFITFPGTITKFSDNIKQNWTEEKVYGRMDPILTYTGTDRKLNFTWNIIAKDYDEAELNQNRLSLLAKMQYPVYEETGVLKASPLFRIQIANLVVDNSANSVLNDEKSTTVSRQGLVCKMDGFEYTPDFTHGAFIGQFKKGNDHRGHIFAKYHEMKCSCTVLHTHNLGWNEDRTFRGVGFGAFPYSVLSLEDKVKFSQQVSRLPGTPQSGMGEIDLAMGESIPQNSQQEAQILVLEGAIYGPQSR